MAFPIPNIAEGLVVLKPGLIYIVPNDNTGSLNAYELVYKDPDSSKAIAFPSPANVVIGPGSTVTFNRKGNKNVFLLRDAAASDPPAFPELIEVDYVKGRQYYLSDNTAVFSDELTPASLPGIKFWNYISQSIPTFYSYNLFPNDGINTLYNLVPHIPGVRRASNFVQTTSLNRPHFTHITASSPTTLITGSRFTSGSSNNALWYVGDNTTTYINSNSFHAFAVFQVTSMSNGSDETWANNYQLFGSTTGGFGLHFRTSSLSGFSPDDQYVDVVFTQGNPVSETLTITASMNSLHLLEVYFDLNPRTDGNTNNLVFYIDNSATGSVSASFGGAESLGTMQLGTTVVPVGSGSTTVLTSSVTSSVDLVEIAFACTSSGESESLRNAVRNRFFNYYSFGTPTTFKTPEYLPASAWSRTSPDDFSIDGGNEFRTIVNRLNPSGARLVSPAFISSIVYDGPTVSIVDPVKPITGANLTSNSSAGTGFVFSGDSNFENLFSASQYNAFMAIRPNVIETTSSVVIENEQILGDGNDTPLWGLFLRQHPTSSFHGEVIGLHTDVNSTEHVISASVDLNLINIIDFSYSSASGEIRLQVNNNNAVTASADDVSGSVNSRNMFIGMPESIVGFSAVRNVPIDTDFLEISTHQQLISEPERSLLKKYFFDRYSIFQQ
jgi:hypothetical protein